MKAEYGLEPKESRALSFLYDTVPGRILLKPLTYDKLLETFAAV